MKDINQVEKSSAKINKRKNEKRKETNNKKTINYLSFDILTVLFRF